MPQTDDFEDFDNTEPTEEQLEQARRVLQRQSASRSTSKKNRGKKNRTSGQKIPANAPRPQDRQKPAAQTETEEGDLKTVTLLDEEFTFRLSEMQNNWDVQEGFTDGSPLKIIRGCLGAQQYLVLRSKAIRLNVPVGEVFLEGARAIGAALGMPELGK